MARPGPSEFHEGREAEHEDSPSIVTQRDCLCRRQRDAAVDELAQVSYALVRARPRSNSTRPRRPVYLHVLARVSAAAHFTLWPGRHLGAYRPACGRRGT